MKNIWKKAGLVFGVAAGGLYALFLIVPFFLTGVLNSYAPQISKMVEETSGFKIEPAHMQIVTTPKLTAGIKIGHTNVMLPTGESFLTTDNLQIKLSLLPLLARKIEIDKISADNLIIFLKVQKDGKFLIENYIPQSEESDSTAEPVSSLPLGLELSNKLPDIIVKNYNISFIDMPTAKSYSIAGNQVKIIDFILDKSIRIITDGAVTLDNRRQLVYDIDVFNKIMPDLNLNDIVFNQEQSENSQTSQPAMLNVISIFKSLYDTQLTADLKAKVKIKGKTDDIDINGNILADKLGIAVDGKKLPDGFVSLEFKGNKIKLDTDLYSDEKDITQIAGTFITGKNPKIDMAFKSNASLNGIFAIVDSVAKSVNYTEFDSLSAAGNIDADFSIKSNLKKVHSSGYFKIPSASINYPLYNISINDINADIDFSNDTVNIKNAGFSIFNQLLKLYGSVKNDADADLHLVTDKMQIKGLLAAAAQIGLLKDNDFRSGTISVDAELKGRLNNPKPKINIDVENVNIKNKPSDVTLSLANTNIDLKTDGKNTEGLLNASQIRLVHPLAAVSVPEVNVKFGADDIVISDTYLLLNNSRIDVTGKITDYMTQKLHFEIKANGNLIANDIRNMIPKDIRVLTHANGKLPLSIVLSGNDKSQLIDVTLTANPTNYLSVLEIDRLKGQNMTAKSSIKISADTIKLADTALLASNVPIVTLGGSISNLSTAPKLGLNFLTNKQLGIVIPGFNDSKMLVNGDINIGGTIEKPTLSGTVKLPQIKIPSMALEIDDVNLALDGLIANGNGTVNKLKSGSILAENLSADFSLKNYNILYLNKISGDAFSGKINGDVSYNIAKNSAKINLQGAGMDAVKAIEGAAGIKNALSGTLGFDADISLNLADEIEMMRSLKGKAGFEVKDGSLLNIGRLETMLQADNIKSNSIMKAAIDSIAALPAIKNTAKFKTISGNMTFTDGTANIVNIKTSGPSMCYYITGKYNLLNGTANLTILGRISAEVVKLLGVVGDLSVDKLTSYIPKFGTLTSTIIKSVTTNPRGEKISEIPALSEGETSYKDFKVVFNGGVESNSSVKSFKWLSECDTSQIEAVSLKEQIKTTKEAIQEARQNKVQEFQNKLDEARKQNETQKEQMKNIQNNLKNLFKTSTTQTE